MTDSYTDNISADREIIVKNAKGRKRFGKKMQKNLLKLNAMPRLKDNKEKKRETTIS